MIIMSHSKKITATLSIATSILLQSCGSSTDSTPAVPSEANTKAPELLTSWTTRCTTTSSGTSTTTSASGGGGSVSGGTAFKTSAIFNADGTARLSKDSFASTNCNANTLTRSENYSANYFIEGAGMAKDGSPATNIRYHTANSTTYSIFQVVGGVSLYLGDFETSTPGNNGTSVSTRLDGLSPELDKN